MLAVLTGRAKKADPTTFIASFGMWGIICSISLLLPGNVFDKTNIYAMMARIYPQDFYWGLAMFVDGLALQLSIFSSSTSLKASVAAYSAVFWMMVGSLMLLDGWSNGWFVITGAYSVWGAMGCFMAITQWVNATGD